MSVIDGPNFSSSENLIFYLDAANPKSYTGSTSTWFDLSPNANHFTLFNNPVRVENGTTGTYLTFNGTTQYARSRNAINFNQYSAVTFEIAFRSQNTQTQILYETTGTGGSTATGGITLLINSDNTSTRTDTYLSNWQNYGPRLFAFTKTSTSTFNLITETFVKNTDPTGRISYVNNVQTAFLTNNSVTSATSTTTTGLSFSNTWTFIASRAGTSNFLNGDIAWIRAFGTKMSSSNLESNLYTISLRQNQSYTGTSVLTSLPGGSLGSTASIILVGSNSVTSRFGDSTPTITSFFSGLTNPGFYTSTGVGDYTGYYKFVMAVNATLTFSVGGASGGFSTGSGSGTYLNFRSRGRLISGTMTLTAGTEVQFFAGKFGQTAHAGGGGGASVIAIKSGATLIPVVVAAGGGSWSSASSSFTTSYNAAALSITPSTAAAARAAYSTSNNFNVAGGGGWGRADNNNAGWGGSGWLSGPINSTGFALGGGSGPVALSLGASGGYATNSSAGATGGFGGGGGSFATNYYGAGGGGYNGGCESGDSPSGAGAYATYSVGNGNFYDNNFAAISYVNTSYSTNAVDAGLNGGNPASTDVGGIVSIIFS